MKIALITGASRGIGKSAAINTAKRGNGVILTYNSHAEEADAVVAEIKAGGGKAVALKLDVRKVSTFDGFVEQVQKTLQSEWNVKAFDYLVNNAGTAQRTLIKDTTEEQVDQLFAVHYKGPFFLTQKLIPIMNDGGQVLNISSGLARFSGMYGVATYGALKGAIEVLTRYIAKEYSHRKIRANIVAPGAIDTNFAGPNKRSEEEKKMIGANTALGRCGDPDDIGVLIASLLSDDSRWVNGQRIEASGGVYL